MGAGKKDIIILYWFDLFDFYVHNKKEEYENAGPRKSKFWGVVKREQEGRKKMVLWKEVRKDGSNSMNK